MNSIDLLARKITKKAGLETFYIILLLADKHLVNEAFKAYAYFRWLDDQVDEILTTKSERLSFLKRQKKIIDETYENKNPKTRTPEEEIIKSLIIHDKSPNSLLKSYIYHFFEAIKFDAIRHGKTVSRKELEWYSTTIGKAVTDCICYFIGNENTPIKNDRIYKAATAAHIVHMLRDFESDIKNGFINIPKELIGNHNLDLINFSKPVINTWIKDQTLTATKLFSEGKKYIFQIPLLRRRIAALLYCYRFEPLLKNLQKEQPKNRIKKVIVVGAGVGGLGTAIQLAKAGFPVSIYEKNSKPGGRCSAIKEKGHTFDSGPTMYLYPELYKDFFESVGENIDNYLTIIPSDPAYLLSFSDGHSFKLTQDLDNLAQQIDLIEKDGKTKLSKMMDMGKAHYEFSMDRIVNKNIKKPTDYFNLINLLKCLSTGALKNHYSSVSEIFVNPNLKSAFTFQDSYLSMSPFDAPAIFSQLSYMELAHGSYIPKGGMYKVIEVLEKIAKKLGVKFYYDSEVAKINISGNRTKGITLTSGQKVESDCVIINADLTYAYSNLLPKSKKAKKILSKKYSCSAMGFHWGLDKVYPELLTHNLFFSDTYKESFSNVIEGHSPPLNPHFYIQAPTRTDPSRAPKNQDTLSVIIPINNLNNAKGTDWSTYQKTMRDYVIKRLKSVGITDLEKHIKFEIPFLPQDWQTRLNLTYGAIYGLHHNLSQIGYLRESRKHPRYKNLFFVGASTHPGSGLPTVLKSAIFTAEDIIETLPLQF